MITLYQFPPLKELPNLSPFCLKLETYLRMTNIPFEIHSTFNLKKSPKGKLPYIVDNGETISDSGLIIDYLKKRYGDTLDQHLTKEQKAQAVAFQRLIEEHLYWILVYSRWGDPATWEQTKNYLFGHLSAFQRMIIPNLVRRNLRKEVYHSGIGRHSREEIYQLGYQDIAAIADFLGDKPYFLGDKPTSIDASLYGSLANLFLGPLTSLISEYARQHPNLSAFVERMRTQYYVG